MGEGGGGGVRMALRRQVNMRLEPFHNRAKEEEDARELKLGPDFQSSAALMNSQVIASLESRAARAQEKGDAESLSAVFTKSLDYAKRVAQFKREETSGAVSDLLTERGLEPFEVAVMGNLCPETADEVAALIPSVTDRFEAAEIEAMLAEVERLRNTE